MHSQGYMAFVFESMSQQARYNLFHPGELGTASKDNNV